MVYYFPVIGAVALAVGTILERIVLRIKKVDIGSYQVASFLAIIISIAPLLYFFWQMEPAALEAKNIFVFALVILFSIIANLLVFYSLKWEKVGNLEPARVLEPLFIILLAIAFSFFAGELYERNIKVIAPALIASFALIFSHIRRHHLEFNRYFMAAIAGSFFFAAELVISRLILDFYSPITFYFLRSSAIFVLSLLIFRPNFQGIKTKTAGMIFATGIIWVIYRVIVYYGYLQLGVISTTLILMLGPIFIYALAWLILREKISWRNFAAAIIIVASIAYALI